VKVAIKGKFLAFKIPIMIKNEKVKTNKKYQLNQHHKWWQQKREINREIRKVENFVSTDKLTCLKNSAKETKIIS
jgi:hypothetical protein